MANHIIKVIMLLILIFFSLIISLPIIILSDTGSNYGKIYESIPYYYEPANPTSINNLIVNTDIADIELNYIDEPVNYIAKFVLKVDMSGKILDRKSYLDYFNIIFTNESGNVNFTLKIREGVNFEEILTLLNEISLKVILRVDIVCDIRLNVDIEGNVKIAVPYLVSIRNVFTNVSKGDIQYDLSYCYIDGNISGIAKSGNISFKVIHVQYSQNSKLTFINDIGHTLIYILQDCDIGANITGIGITVTGIIQLIYKDESPNIGAQFILYNKRDLGNEANNTAVGFENDPLPSLAGQKFYSYDFPAQNNYNFSLYKPYPSDMGNFIWNLYSVPN